METKKIVINPNDIQDSLLEEAAELLRRGKVVAFPTETVYGLGADALNADACREIFAVKGRPADNPLIVHIADITDVHRVVRQWPQQAQLCFENFWPGPLTLVLPKQAIVPDTVSGGLDTVAVRMPSHPIALALIRVTGRPLAAPSANISGKPSPTEAEHVWQDFNGRIPLLIDGGTCSVGLESTVLDLTGPIPVILRPGGVTREQLAGVLGRVELDKALRPEQQPKAPGMKYRHYAPEGQVVLLNGSHSEKVRQVQARLDSKRDGCRYGLVAMQETITALGQEHLDKAEAVFNLGSAQNPEEAASRLFAGLRYCDEQKADIILAEEMPIDGIGLAFMNRLRKAASK